MPVGAFSFLWGAAALLPLFFCTGGACHALRLRSLRVVHFVAPASCRHLSFLRDLRALVSVLSVVRPCLFFCFAVGGQTQLFFLHSTYEQQTTRRCTSVETNGRPARSPA